MLDIYFENNDTLAYSWEEAITIEETGMYYLWFVICDEDLASASVRGQTTWKNPTGVLPNSWLPALLNSAGYICQHGTQRWHAMRPLKHLTCPSGSHK